MVISYRWLVFFHGEPEWLLIFIVFCGYFHGESEWLLIING